MKSKIFYVFSLAFVFAIASRASFADVTPPVVKNFAVSSPSALSGQLLSFTWTIENGSASVTILCPAGVVLTNLDGSSYTCNTAHDINQSLNSIDIFVYNFGGATRTMVATIIPKDTSGVSYPGLSQSAYVNIQTDPEPILNFFSSASTTGNEVQSFQPVTISWEQRVLASVNMRMSCNDKIIATSSSYLSGQNFICGMMLFPADQAYKGTFAFSAYNKSQFDSDLIFTLMPAVGDGSYDASHGKSITINVAPYNPTMPNVAVFSIPGNRVENGATTTLSWAVSNTGGVKIRSSCGDLTITMAVGSTTMKTTCDNFLWGDILVANGTSSISFLSKSHVISPVTLSLIPQRPDGVFDTAYGKSLNIIVDPKGGDNYGVAGNTLSVSPIPVSNNPVATVKTVARFTKSISFGSRGTEVTNLQTFLKNYPDLYPEGLVTGYFGVATVRAIKKFQEKYKIASPGVAGYGMVGPKTRAKLNEF